MTMYVCVAYLVFEQYQKSRMQFVQTVADLSSRPQNIDTLQTAGEELSVREVGGAGHNRPLHVAYPVYTS